MENNNLVHIIEEFKKVDTKTYNEKFIINNNAQNKSLVEIKDLTKKYKNLTVIKNLNINFYEGENVAVLGGNGAGKTTLMEMIAGLNKPTSGSIEYKYDFKNSFLEKIGIQFQDSSFPKGIKVKRVIKFVNDIYGTNISKRELDAMLQIFGINEFYNKNASSLSGGQSQRLNCLLSILHKPSIIILDELSTGLDITIRNKIKTFIKMFAKDNNMNILLVSHNLDEIEYLADRIVLLKNGEVFVDASKEQVIEKFGSLQNMIELYI